MNKGKLFLVVLMVSVVVFLSETWSLKRTRFLQDIFGITSDRMSFGKVLFSLPKTWVLLCSQMTDHWADGKMYGLIPAECAENNDDVVMLFVSDEGEGGTIGFYNMPQDSVERWSAFLKSNGCGFLVKNDSSVSACNVVKVSGYEGVMVVAMKSAALYFPKSGLMMSAPRKDLLDDFLDVGNVGFATR